MKGKIIQHFADRLLEAIENKGGPVCVGIDPVFDRLPEAIRNVTAEEIFPEAVGLLSEAERRAYLIQEYCGGLLESIADHVPCVKFQSACFERYHSVGVEVLHQLIQQARQLGLMVIADCKRNDIGISAEHYAAANLADPTEQNKEEDVELGPDALTINSYLGADGVNPFVKVGADQGKGLFALVRTSNPSGDVIQNLELVGGGTVSHAMAKLIAELGDGDNLVGSSGYSLLGAVVGATKPDDVARLRELMPQQIFLVPGMGAQGASADDTKACFKPDGTGAIVTASRSVIYAFENNTNVPWQQAIENAAIEMRDQVNAAVRG